MNKHRGSNFEEYLLEQLQDDEFLKAFLLDNLSEGTTQDILRAIVDAYTARRLHLGVDKPASDPQSSGDK